MAAVTAAAAAMTGAAMTGARMAAPQGLKGREVDWELEEAATEGRQEERIREATATVLLAGSSFHG